MRDRYLQLMHSPPGRVLARPLGLPVPAELARHRPGGPLIDGVVLLGAAPGGRLLAAVARVLAGAGVGTAVAPDEAAVSAASSAGLHARIVDSETPGPSAFRGLIFDASGITDSTALVELQRFFHPAVAGLGACGRVIVLGLPAGHAGGPRAEAAQRALEGFTRSLGKELGPRGSTVQLVQVARGAQEHMECTVRFLLSPRSAYVSGQVVTVIGGVPAAAVSDWERPLDGAVALVTGAARGIGASIARTLARDGARVVGIDVEDCGDALTAVMTEVGGSGLTLDITSAEAPERICAHLSGGLDVLVHNAGVTRDRTIAKMPRERWSELMEINLSSQERINESLLDSGLLAINARVVCVSSMAGIAGNPGQTNYAASKAGVIGMVRALAPRLAETGGSINAVAPGFIQTAMTDAMPFGPREAGRRLNSLRQAGLPVDVAETIAWLASPACTGVNGNVIRVCGQSLLGA